MGKLWTLLFLALSLAISINAQCTTLTAVTSTTNTFTSHSSFDGVSDTYSASTTSCWLITAEASPQRVEVVPEIFNLQERSYEQACSVNDYVAMYDGSSDTATEINMFCGNNSFGVTSSDGSMYIKFVSNSDTTVGIGFRFTYKSEYNKTVLVPSIALAVVSVLIIAACVVGIVYLIKLYLKKKKEKRGDKKAILS